MRKFLIYLTVIALAACSYDHSYAAAVVGTDTDTDASTGTGAGTGADTGAGDTAKVRKIGTGDTVAHDTIRPPIIIDVLELTPPEKLLDTVSYREILGDIIRRYDAKDSTVIAYTRESRDLVRSYHPFFAAMYLAYVGHRPFELSPEALWLLICQGFSHHVNYNEEELRSMFVDFVGKQTLYVCADDLSLDNPDSPWEKYFPQFTEQIAVHTGRELIDVLTADFTTSTPASRTASQITAMESMKQYFDYSMALCGIPQVILHGTPEDWQSIVDRVKVLRKYKLDWWVDEMLPVLKKIVRASNGEVNNRFWRRMFKYYVVSSGCASSRVVNGWISRFYPYNCYGGRQCLYEFGDLDAGLPPEMASVPLDFHGIPLTLWAGFVGVAQNSETMSLRPELGWFITK